MKKDITIHRQATIKEAMESLDRTAEKVLLVTDSSNILIGTLTDGDIRRYILKGNDLSGTIENTYNKNPISVIDDEYNVEQVKKILTESKVGLLPVISKRRKIIDFITWENVFSNSRQSEQIKLEAPVVIMAGGKGTRLDPFTRVLPKPLIPVGDKPVIDHIIDRFRVFGANEFYLSINHMAKILEAYFEERDPSYSISFIRESEFRGTAGSLKLLNDTLNSPFFVSNCDIVIDANYSNILKFHLDGAYDISIVAAAKLYKIPYGICELNGTGSLKAIKEKPGYNFLVNTGLYVLNHEILKFIPNNGIFHMLHLIERVKENKGTVGVFPISENSWIDVGQWAEYKEALKDFEL